MNSSKLNLFKDKRFFPIFIVQFCGCFNDNILKNALMILITFKLSHELSFSAYSLVLLANIIFNLPFVLFASLSGQIADKYERTYLVRIIKFAEIAIVLFASYGFYTTNLFILFISIGCMGIHSTFFGPIKYSVLPDQLKKEELLSANGFIEAGTFLSILTGTIMGGWYNYNNNLIIVLSLVMSISGLIASYFMPPSNNSNPEIKINWNIWQETINIIKYATAKHNVYLAILGISWFWFIGAAILAQIPSLTKDIIGANENVANIFLATFSIGVGVGSFLCSKIFNNTITTKYIFISSIGISICCIDLFFATDTASHYYNSEHLQGAQEFLSHFYHLRILFDLFCLAIIGGIYVVPLFTVMQYFSAPAYRSRTVAANNLLNAVFMAFSTILLSLMFFIGFSIQSVILCVGILNIFVAIYIYHLTPNTVIIPMDIWCAIFRFGFRLMYKVEIKGMENYNKAGQKTVIIANHLSYLDPALIASYLKSDIRFAINRLTAQEWWVKPFLKIVKTYPIEPNNPMAIKSLIDEIKNNRKIAIFPEGRTSVTGSLMKIYEGPGMIADKANATILPIRVDGTQFTIFSKIRKIMNGKFSLRRKIVITILPPVKVNAPDNLDNRARRKFIGYALYDMMSDMIFESSDYQNTLFQSLINATKIYGKNTRIMQDVDNPTATYKDVLLKSFIISDLVKQKSKSREIVGLMLPTTTTSMIAFFGIQASNRIPAMINFTSGAHHIISACHTAQITIIYTSRRFIQKAELESTISALDDANISIVYLEDLRKNMTLLLKFKAIIGTLIPETYYHYICQNCNDLDTAVILFTSGTEGAPKAVALSHRNIQANRCQVMARIDFNPYDCAFNALPIFHTFGLTASLVMTLNGVKTFFYPSPLHYRIIPEIVYDIGATIMFGTDTFLAGYANYAHPYDFYSLRYVIAGAEKLKNKTSTLWLEKFGIRIFEGYGVTEASPVISLNTPMHNRPGTVGRVMPKIQYFVQPIDGVQNGGRLCVYGPNIMQGYIKPDKPGVIQEPFLEKLGEYWYDTGDIVSVDSEHYITILGRAKRFAKIAGEMISLGAIEEILNKIDSDATHAAIYIEDEKKGEQIVVFTTSNKINRDVVSKFCQEEQLSELYVPKIINTISAIPLLPIGKVDYNKMIKIAQNSKL